MRISLSASAAKAAPGSKVETANMAASARREILDMVPSLDAIRNVIISNKLFGNATRKYVPATAHPEDSFTQSDRNPAQNRCRPTIISDSPCAVRYRDRSWIV